MRIERTERLAPPRRPAPAAANNGAFASLVQNDASEAVAVPAQASTATAAAAHNAASAYEPAARDQHAKHHGEATLRALASAQAALLGGSPDAARQSLAALADNPPVAADPRLNAVLRAIAVRAAVELARGT